MPNVFRSLLALSISCAACARPEPSLVPLSVGTEHPTPPTRVRAGGAVASASTAPEPAEENPGEDDSGTSEPSGKTVPAPPRPAPDAAASGGEEARSATVPVWEGDYAGEDVSTYEFGGTERAEHDPKALTRVHDQTTDSLKLTLVSSSDGSDLCTLSAKLDGGVATLDPGQECFSSSEGPVTMRGVVQAGTATFEDETLVLEASLTFEVTTPDQEQRGELSYRFEGRRR